MTPDQALHRQLNRGCPADCCCQFCVSDDLDVTAAAHGLDVRKLQRVADESRAAAGSRSPRSGGGSGRAGGGTPGRRRMRLPSDKQLDFIANLCSQRDLGPAEERQGWIATTYPEFFEHQFEFGPRQASALIDALMKLPRRGAAEAAQAREFESKRIEAEFEQGALYPDPADPGTVYLVERSKSSGMLYAKRLLEDGGTAYERGAIGRLDASRKLSLAEAQVWGQRTGVCCQCRARLTNPESRRLGVGPVCRGRFAA